MRIPLMISVVAPAALAALAIYADDETPAPTMSINDLMVTVVAPATDTLWGIDDPQTDEEWQVFIDAANRVVEAGNIIKIGGTGPNDATWAESPAWQGFADRLIGAGVDARAAAENKDVEAMWTAGEVLYPPCEECHLQFHPGVQDYQ
jgi:hypothetical protein